MVIYTCPRCGYSNKIKAHMRKHFLRKFMCSPIREDVNMLYCFQEVLGEKPQNIQKNPELNPKLNPKLNPNEPKIENLSKIEPILGFTEPKIGFNKNVISESQQSCIKVKHECEYCRKLFSTNSHMHRHMRNCKSKGVYTKDELAEAKAEVAANKDTVITELKSQIEVLLTKVGNTTNNNTINININAFGNENMEYITSNIIDKLIEIGPYRSIPRLLQHIHFNPNHKENQNIKIPNRKEKYAKIYNGAKWELRDKKATIEDLSDKAYNLLEDHYDGGNKHMDKFISSYEDENTSKKIHTETELMILNNQDISE